MTTKTLDPGQIVIAWGPHIVSGYADGSFVKASRDADAFSKSVGADGSAVRIRSRNKAGSVEITVQQTSATNDFFAAKALEDELLGTAVMPLIVKDLAGRTVVVAAESWIRKSPDVEESKDMTDRTWILDTGDLELFAGGN
jgi:Protein of unknown function (DUF3277)